MLNIDVFEGTFKVSYSFGNCKPTSYVKSAIDKSASKEFFGSRFCKDSGIVN
jgi:hypothetical protein